MLLDSLCVCYVFMSYLEVILTFFCFFIFWTILILSFLIMFPDERKGTEKSVEEQRETPVASIQEQSQDNNDSSNVLTTSANDDVNSNPAEKNGNEESSSDCADASKGRPMSPGTLALMCDEQDTMFTTTSCPNDFIGQDNLSSQLPDGQGISEAYAEQERIVLTKFRDCLNRLIALGELKGKFLLLFPVTSTANFFGSMNIIYISKLE